MSKNVPRFQIESDTENEEVETPSRISVQLKKEQGHKSQIIFPFHQRCHFFLNILV